MSRIVIHSFGSLGDLHPYLALALELKRRGHEAVFATAACYREYIECRPDNADRVVRLGIGRSVWPRHYTAARAAHELRKLLEQDGYHSRAEQVAKAVRLERGAEVACDALERLLPSAVGRHKHR